MRINSAFSSLLLEKGGSHWHIETQSGIVLYDQILYIPQYKEYVVVLKQLQPIQRSVFCDLNPRTKLCRNHFGILLDKLQLNHSKSIIYRDIRLECIMFDRQPDHSVFIARRTRSEILSESQYTYIYIYKNIPVPCRCRRNRRLGIDICWNCISY